MKTFRIFALFTVMAVLFCRIPVQAANLDTEMECSITIYDLYGEEEIPVEGVTITVSQVASGSYQGQYRLLEAYQGSGVTDSDINSLTLASDVNTIVSKLEEVTDPDAWTVQTDGTGKAQIEGLPVGLYLITAKDFETGECIYVSTPSLVAVPCLDGEWQYDVEVYIKTEKTKKQTPDTETQVPGTEPPTPDTETSVYGTEPSVPDTETETPGTETSVTGMRKTGDIALMPEMILLFAAVVILLIDRYYYKKGGRNQC